MQHDYPQLMREWMHEQGIPIDPRPGGWQKKLIRCPLPGHEDKNPSFSINTESGGWKCFGCEEKGGYKDLMKALGQEMPTNDRTPYSPPKPRSSTTPIQSRKKPDRSTQQAPGTQKANPVVVGRRTWDWVDSDGVVYQQIRQDFADGKKDIRWNKDMPRPKGGKEKEIFYPSTLGDGGGIVVVVEGAKCADVVYELNMCDAYAIVATHQLPNDDLVREWLFRYEDIVLWPDHDKHGHAAMDKIIGQLFALGYEGKIRRVDTCDMPDKGDVADLDDGIWKKIDTAEVVTPPEEDGEERKVWLYEPMERKEIGSEFPPKILSIAGKGGAFLSIGEVAILAAAGGVGKSTLTAQVVGDMRRCGLDSQTYREGVPIVDGVFHAHTGGPILMLSYEDNLAVVRRRLMNAIPDGWDEDALVGIYGFNAQSNPLFGVLPGTFNEVGMLESWEMLENTIGEIGPRLVVIDPALSAFTGNSNQAEHVRAFVEGLCTLAEAAHCAILLVAHSNKESRKENDPFDPGQVGGSTHFVDRARGVAVLTRQASGVQLSVVKANYGPSHFGIFLDPVHECEFNPDWDSDDEGELLRYRRAGEWAHKPHRQEDPHNAEPGAHIQKVKACYIAVLEDCKNMTMRGVGRLHRAVKIAYPDINFSERQGQTALKMLIEDEGLIVATPDPENKQLKVLTLRGSESYGFD